MVDGLIINACRIQDLGPFNQFYLLSKGSMDYGPCK